MGADLQGMFGASTPTLFAVNVARRAAHATGRARAWLLQDGLPGVLALVVLFDVVFPVVVEVVGEVGGA